MTDWGTISSLATAGGTLVLGVATFASVRSANRSNRVTERALLATIRPVLVPSRLEDPVEKVGFMDSHWLKVPGGRAVVEVVDDVIYLACAIRNVGSGLAVLDRWDLQPRRILSGDDGGVGSGTPTGSGGSRATSTSRRATRGSGRARCGTPTRPCTPRRWRRSGPARG